MAFLTFRVVSILMTAKICQKTVLSRSICRREIWQFLFLSTSELPAKPIVKKKVIMCLQDRKSQKQEDLFPHRYTRLYQEP